MITTVTADPWEWYKFWYEIDDSESYSPQNCSIDEDTTKSQDNEHTDPQ